jgi:MHS family proline/betaine transporter-like MFS transporter
MIILLAQTWFATIVGFYIGPVPALLVEIFPTRLRYSGLSLSYNICAAMFGGTTPMVCEWLVSNTGSKYSIAFYIMICSAISLVSLYFYKDRHEQPLQ